MEIENIEYTTKGCFFGVEGPATAAASFSALCFCYLMPLDRV